MSTIARTSDGSKKKLVQVVGVLEIFQHLPGERPIQNQVS